MLDMYMQIYSNTDMGCEYIHLYLYKQTYTYIDVCRAHTPTRHIGTQAGRRASEPVFL